VSNAATTMYTGEIALDSMKREYKRVLRITSGIDNIYNADATIVYDSLYLELLLLETSSEFGHLDTHKHMRDHVKAGYGVIAMLHSIADQYKYGDFNLFMGVIVFFMYTKENEIKMWSFELPSYNKIYVSNCLGYAVIPDRLEGMEKEARELGSLFWTLKLELGKSIGFINKLKQSHFTNSRKLHVKLKAMKRWCHW
jgi:hypothetical protein